MKKFANVEERRAYFRARYRAKREKGECVSCPNPAVKDRAHCSKHGNESREYRREHAHMHRMRKREKGECARCPKPSKDGGWYCEEHAAENVE